MHMAKWTKTVWRGTAQYHSTRWLSREVKTIEGWMPKHWCFQTAVVLEKTLESPLDRRESQPVNPKGNQCWIFIRKTDASSRTNSQRRCPFHLRGVECKSRKSRDTWSNRLIWPWSTEWSRAKANRVLPRERTGHSKHPLPTTQENTLHMDITRWSTPKSIWLYSLQPRMEKLYTVSKNKIGSQLWLRLRIPYTAKFRLKLKKAEKTTRTFKYDLHQILYDYTVEVRNKI